jgi:hypothetical protein
MKNRNTLFGLVAAAMLVAGIIWWSKQTPTEKPVVISAPAKPVVQVAAPAVPPKPAVVAPTAPVVAASENPKTAENPVAPSSTDADLNTAVNDLITTLQSGDVNAFVQNFIAPNMMDMAKSAMEDQAARNPNVNVTPEMKAQMEQMMAQRMPMMIEQMTQQLSQRPDTLQGMQKMATALQSAQTAPPQMNEAGDRATYTLQSNGDKNVPASVTLVLRNGKWTLDFLSMAQAAAAGGN